MSQFVEQVQILMQVQQIKSIENAFGKVNNYNWLINKKSSVIWMSSKDEFKIRKCLAKLSEEQQVRVMRQLLKWLEEHPYVSTLKVPEMCIAMLIKMDTSTLIKNANLTRISSFRNSLRRFSSVRNKVAPEKLDIPVIQTEKRRSVTFNDVLEIYCISN